MSQIENKHLRDQTKQELPDSLKELPYKIAQMKAKVYKAFGFVTLASLILTSCTPEGQAQENKPAVTQTIDGLNLNEDNIPEESKETNLTPELTEALQEALLIQFENIDDLSAEELSTLEENTAEFIALVEEGIEKNPDLKEKIFTANGPIVTFDPARLIHHNGMWAYFAPEGLPGDPLASSLLMISTADDSKGELRVCTVDGAGSVLGIDLPSGSHFLDFDMINGNSVCMVRNQSNIIQAITDTAGQWVSPKNSDYVGLGFRKSAFEYGQSALDLARNGNGKEEATPTLEATPAAEFTATPEAMTQAEIRAEILAAGVNLDDLASSKDQWTSSHVALETIQNYIDNLNFGRETEGAITTVVIGLEGFTYLEELDQAVTTDTGWQLTSFAKLAYKTVDGDWQIIKVPLSAYHQENELMWPKDVSTRGQFYLDANEIIFLDSSGKHKASFLNDWTGSSIANNYHWGTGSFIRLFTAWPENPKYANNDCILGDPPRYSQEQLIEFRKTGDPSIFGYQDRDGYYIYWPIVTFDADLSELANYNQD